MGIAAHAGGLIFQRPSAHASDRYDYAHGKEIDSHMKGRGPNGCS